MFHADGVFLDFWQSRNMLVIAFVRGGPPYFNSSLGIPSGPLALPVGSIRKAFFTSSSVIVLSSIGLWYRSEFVEFSFWRWLEDFCEVCCYGFGN